MEHLSETSPKSKLAKSENFNGLILSTYLGHGGKNSNICMPSLHHLKSLIAYNSCIVKYENRCYLVYGEILK
jgi:hypothetical protein